MNYEEKYKEALSRARESYRKSIEQGWTCDKCIYEEVFPELKESEDERIRKMLIRIFKKADMGGEIFGEGVSYKQVIAWLEKQGEQKHTELPKGEDYGIDGLWHAIRILEKTLGNVEGYQSDDGILEHKCAISAVKELYEKKPTAWSEEDERNLKGIIDCIDGLIFIDSDQLNWLKSLKPNHWKPSEEQMSMLLAVLNDSNNITAESVHIALKSLYNDLLKL